MFTEGEYMWAWVAYLVGAGLFMAAFWMATRKIPWFELKYLLRVIFAVLLFVPWYSDENSEYLSPAWIISGIEGVFDGPEAFWRAGTPLMISLGLSAILSCLVFIGLWYRGYRLKNA